MPPSGPAAIGKANGGALGRSGVEAFDRRDEPIERGRDTRLDVGGMEGPARRVGVVVQR